MVARSAHEQVLQHIAEEACRDAPGCTAAAITVVHDGAPALVAATSLLGRQMEQSQWDAGQGPGLDAIRQFQVFNVACLSSSRCWPEFSRVAAGRGIRSMLAVPITLRGRAVGVLQLYSPEPDAFAGHERAGLHHAARVALTLAAGSEPPWAEEGQVAPAAPGAARAVS